MASLSVGHRHLSNLRSPVLQRENMGGLGILGIDAVSSQKLVLDFHRHAPGMSTPRHFARVSIDFPAREVRFLLDA